MNIRNIDIRGFRFTGLIDAVTMPASMLKGLPMQKSYFVVGHFHLGLQGIYLDYVELVHKQLKPKLITEDMLNYPAVERQLALKFRGAA